MGWKQQKAMRLHDHKQFYGHEGSSNSMKTSLPYITSWPPLHWLCMAPWSVSVLTVALQCSHSVFELAVGLHSVPFLGVGIQEHTHKEKTVSYQIFPLIAHTWYCLWGRDYPTCIPRPCILHSHMCFNSDVWQVVGRDKSILLLFSPIFLSGNSFYSHLLCSRFCSKFQYYTQS